MSLPTIRLKLKVGPPPSSSSSAPAEPVQPTSTSSSSSSLSSSSALATTQSNAASSQAATASSSSTASQQQQKKKKGNGWTTTSRRRTTAANAAATSANKKFKKPLFDVLTTALALFKKRDTYGFFLDPVDTTAVPDYLSIIKHPMDFGTIEKRINDRFYSSIEEFQKDVELVCNNCKTYNAPNTLYHKIASQILKFSTSYLARIKQSTTIVNSDPPTRSETPVPMPPVISNTEPKWKYASKHKKRKQQRRETMDDGSLAIGYWYLAYLGQTSSYRMKASEREAEQEERVLESWRFVPKPTYPYFYAGTDKEDEVLAGWLAEEVDDVKSIQLFESVLGTAYCDYGPYEYPTLVPAVMSTGMVHPALASMRSPTLVPLERDLAAYWTEMYGDVRGAVYRDSMVSFVKGMPDYVQERVMKRIDGMTDGADSVTRMVEGAFEDVKKGQDVEFVLKRVVLKAQQAEEKKMEESAKKEEEQSNELHDEEKEENAERDAMVVDGQPDVFVEYHTDEEDDSDSEDYGSERTDSQSE